jgi:uncharacterized FlgJ-related protein
MKKLQINFAVVIIVSCIVAFMLSAFQSPVKKEERVVYKVTKEYIKVTPGNEFSEDKLYAYIKSLNIRFPHIVIAQAVIETGSFRSNMFLKHNNLFGMRCPSSRPTTNIGKAGGYAKFENWKQSVVDYALFQAAYMSKIRSEEEYFSYIGRNYAHDSTYVEKVKKIAYKYK